MDRLAANRYISLQQKIASSGGGVPQELIEEVEALDTTVNGDETQDPPVVGLVDIVGDLENSVEDLDTTVNGDSTTTPATPGLVDRVSDIESAFDRTDLSAGVDLTSYTTDPYITDTDGYARIAGASSGQILLDGYAILTGAGAGVYIACYVKAGSKLTINGAPTAALFIPLTHNT